jgi:hypothetical protein
LQDPPLVSPSTINPQTDTPEPQGAAGQSIPSNVLRAIQPVRPQVVAAPTGQPAPKANASALAGTTPVRFEGWIQFGPAADTLTTRAQVTFGGPQPSGAAGFVLQARYNRIDNLELNRTTNQFRLLAGVAGKVRLGENDSLSYSVGGYNSYSFGQSGLSAISFGIEGSVSYTNQLNKLLAFNAWGQLNVGANFPIVGQPTIPLRADAGVGVVANVGRFSAGIYPVSGYFSDSNLFADGNSQSQAYAPYAEASLKINENLKLVGRMGGEIRVGGAGDPAFVLRAGFSVSLP